MSYFTWVHLAWNNVLQHFLSFKMGFFFFFFQNGSFNVLLVYYQCKADHADWLMHEFSLHEDELKRCKNIQVRIAPTSIGIFVSNCLFDS